ncbi:MAG TPA: cell division protein CrgA [Acidimicrobiales bacterium]|jgi:hypothetical protein|nr:cell division protein CrgA [Acidimicrobiales bacterium]
MAKPERSRPKGGEPPSKGARRSAPAARPTTGRVTPKGSNRYTPPVPKEMKVSPRWVPVLMFTLLVLGMVVIVANYLEVLPGEAKNTYLFLGLGLITAGFITATRYR